MPVYLGSQKQKAYLGSQAVNMIAGGETVFAIPGPISDLFDANFKAGKWRFQSQDYSTEAAWLAAIGGVKSFGIAIGPYDVPAAPELLVNGDFSGGATGWTAQNSGQFTVVSGEGVLEANNGNNPGFSRSFPAALGKAYRARGTSRRGTGTGTHGIGVSVGAVLSAAVFGPSNGNTTPANTDITFGSESASLMYAGGRAFIASGTGTTIYDNLSVKEVLPFAGWLSEFSARIAATTPAAVGAGDKTLFYAGQNSANGNIRNNVKLAWTNTKHLVLTVTYGSAIAAQLDMGVVEVNTPFEVLFSLGTNAFRAQLNGGQIIEDLAGTMIGAGMVFLGRSLAGETWDGVIDRVSISRALTAAEFYADGGMLLLAAWGDSLTAGSGGGGTTYPLVGGVAFNPDRTVVNFGIGGQTSTQIAARMNAQPILVTVTGNQIPASGGVAVTAKNINVLFNSGNFSGTQDGTLAGVKGTISTDASGNWTFTRASAGSVVPCPAGTQFICDLGVAVRRKTSWLWLGRNSAQAGYTVEGDIAAAIAYLGHSRYLIGSVLISTADSPANIATITNRNAALKALYGTKFVDVMAALQAAVDGSPEDAADVAAGFTPRSKRADAVHLNAAGYTIVGQLFQAAHIANGYP